MYVSLELEWLEDRRLLSGFSGPSRLFPPPAAPLSQQRDDGARLERPAPGSDDRIGQVRPDNRGPGSGDRLGEPRPDNRGPGSGDRLGEMRPDNRGPGSGDQSRPAEIRQDAPPTNNQTSLVSNSPRSDSSGPGNGSTTPRTENRDTSSSNSGQRQVPQSTTDNSRGSSTRSGSSAPQVDAGRTPTDPRAAQFVANAQADAPSEQQFLPPPPPGRDGRPGPRERPDPTLTQESQPPRDVLPQGLRPEAIAAALAAQAPLPGSPTNSANQEYRGFHEWAQRAGIDLGAVGVLPRLPATALPGTTNLEEPGVAAPTETTSSTPAETLGLLPVVDFQALESGVRQFLNQLDDLAAPLVNLTGVKRLSPWLVALIAAGAACEITRRQLRQNARQLVFAQDFLDHGTTRTW